MLLNDDFITNFCADPINKTSTLIELVEATLSQGEDWTDSDYEVLIEAYAFVSEAIASNTLPLKMQPPPISGKSSKDCRTIVDFLRAIKERSGVERTRLQLETFQTKFKSALGGGFSYEFSQGDLERVQTIINELRDNISAIKNLDEDHKQRVLKRLEKLQSELHKKVSDLDRFWGLIGDAGVAIGKLGQDAKPIVDRIREITDIVWKTQSRAEELPSGAKPPNLEYTPGE